MTTVHDLGFTAYLLVKHNAELVDEPFYDGRRYNFKLSLPKDVIDKAYLEYLKSEFQAFDRTIKQLKKMVHQKAIRDELNRKQDNAN